MQVLEDLDPEQENGVHFTMSCHPTKILMNRQEIIANILFYEKRYLLFGGMSEKSAEMQDLLGIQYKPSGSSYEFIAKSPPSWNFVQATKVCNLICIYKLAEIVSLVNGSIESGTSSHNTPLETTDTQFSLPQEGKQIMKKISDWPELLQSFNNSHLFSETSGAAMPPDLTSQPKSVQLLHALYDADCQKVAAKIRHNILIAAAHIAYIKEHHVSGEHTSDNNLPDLPDLTSSWVFVFLI
jgi:hypothetical protein